MQQGHLKAQPEQEDLLPRWLLVKLLAGGRVPCHVALSRGSVLTARQLVFHRVSDLRGTNTEMLVSFMM